MYDRLKSAYLKKVRTEKGLKLSAVASLTHYSTAYISELERGKKSLNDSEWIIIFELLGYSIFDNSTINQILSYFSDIYQCIYFAKTANKKDLILKLRNNSSYLEHSVVFIQYHLILFIYFLDSNEIYQSKPHFCILTEYQDYLSIDEKYTFDVYKSLYLLKCNCVNEATILLEALLKQHTFIQPITSMLHYYYSHLCLISDDYLNGYHHLRIAKDSYLSVQNIKRYCIALQLEATIYSEQNKFAQSNHLFDKLLELLTKDDINVYNITCINYSYNLIKQQNFLKSLKILELCNSNSTLIPQILFNRSWSLYHLDKNECKKYINSIDFDTIDDKYIECCLKIIDLLIDDECSSTIELLINNALQELHLDLESSAKEFLLTQLLEYYRRTDNIKKQNKTLEALVALYKGEPHENL